MKTRPGAPHLALFETWEIRRAACLYLYIYYFKLGGVNGHVSEKYICHGLNKLETKQPFKPLDNIF
ncbi:MAG: hypothetical protein WBY61_06420, partial [Terriglobales bacterium]